ncbi:MAG: hypothetical protein ACOCZE_13585 [Planctomycetota bacterium]
MTPTTRYTAVTAGWVLACWTLLCPAQPAPAQTAPAQTAPAQTGPGPQPQTPEPPDSPKPQVAPLRYLPVRLSEESGGVLMFQAGVEVTNAPHRWFRVSFAICQGPDKALNVAGKDQWVWGHLFSPEKPARWTDIRFGFSRQHISELNLPAGQSHLVYVVCLLEDPATEEKIPDPWQGALPLRIRFDKAGRLEEIDVLQLDHVPCLQAHPTVEIPAQPARLEQSRLKLRPQAGLYLASDPNGHRHRILQAGRDTVNLAHPARGRFFQPIETEAQAVELVQLGYPGSVLIGSPDQLTALAEAAGAKTARDVKPGCHSSQAETIGYEVEMVLAQAGPSGLLDRIVHVRTLVGRDGRLGTTVTDLIPLPDSAQTSEARDTAFRAALKQGQHLVLDPRIQPHGQAETIPCPPHTRRGDWLDPDNWTD